MGQTLSRELQAEYTMDMQRMQTQVRRWRERTEIDENIHAINFELFRWGHHADATGMGRLSPCERSLEQHRLHGLYTDPFGEGSSKLGDTQAIDYGNTPHPQERLAAHREARFPESLAEEDSRSQDYPLSAGDNSSTSSRRSIRLNGAKTCDAWIGKGLKRE